MLLLPVTHIVLSPRKETGSSIGYLYAFQSCSLCLLCFSRWSSHTRLLCPTEGEPTNKTQYCWFTTANQKTPASVRKQEIMLFSNLSTKKTAWDIYATHRLDGVSSRCRQILPLGSTKSSTWNTDQHMHMTSCPLYSPPPQPHYISLSDETLHQTAHMCANPALHPTMLSVKCHSHLVTTMQCSSTSCL